MSVNIEKFKDYQIKKITSLNFSSDIVNDWLTLINKKADHNIYVDPQYFKSQFKLRSTNSNPFILIFYKNSNPAALVVGKNLRRNLPFKIGYVKFNSPKLDVLEVEIDGIITNDYRDSAETVYDYLTSLLENKSFNVIEFQHFSENNTFWQNLNHPRKNERICKLNGKEYICNIRDSKTGEQNVYHKAKTLRNFKRSDKIITNALSEINIKKYTDFEQISEFLNAADQICKNSYHCKLGVGIENNEYWRRNLESLIKEKLFLGFILFNGSKPIAYNYGLLYKNYFFGFNMSFDLNYRNIQPGTYLLRRIIELLVKLKIDFYHLGYGEAEYKKLYSNLSYDEATFLKFSKSLKAQLIYKTIIFNNLLNSKLINFLDRAGFYNKIKKIWRLKISD